MEDKPDAIEKSFNARALLETIGGLFDRPAPTPG
jgi:hypothetical protein